MFSERAVVIGSGTATVEFSAKKSPLALAVSVIALAPGSSLPSWNLARARIGSMWFLDINLSGDSGCGRKWN